MKNSTGTAVGDHAGTDDHGHRGEEYGAETHGVGVHDGVGKRHGFGGRVKFAHSLLTASMKPPGSSGVTTMGFRSLKVRMTASLKRVASARNVPSDF